MSDPQGRAANERLMITFLWQLPYRLPLGHLATIGVKLPGDLGKRWDFVANVQPIQGLRPAATNMRRPYVSARFWQRKTTTPLGGFIEPLTDVLHALRAEGWPDEPPAIERTEVDDYTTIVEAVTQLPDTDPVDKALSDAFDACLAAVDRIGRGYALSSRDLRASRLRREMLDPLCPYLLRTPSGEPRGFGALMLNANFPSDVPPLDEAGTQRVIEFVRQLTIQHPLLESLEFALERDRAIRSANYGASLVWAATSIEMLLNVLLRLLLAEEGVSRDQIAQVFDDQAGLRTRLERQYAARLGGDWSTEKSPVMDWWAHCYAPRSRVVHGGHEPSRQDAVDAAEACGRIDRFLSSRLAEMRFRYPKTAYTKLGQPGLARRGLLSARMEQVLDAIDPQIPAFWSAAR